MKLAIELETENILDVRRLRDMLTGLLDEIDENATEGQGGRNNIETLHEFLQEASENQLTVLRWMKDHPGIVSAHVLKAEMPFLAPPGTVSGVFRPGRWVRLAGGTKEGFPFLQVSWDHAHGCGVYRGLTEEEAAALDI